MLRITQGMIRNEKPVRDTTINANKTYQDTTIGDVDEQPPSFPGGIEAMFAFIEKNIHPIPGQSGRVVVTFIVEKNGNLNDIKVRRSASPELDAEALRVVRLMPRWIPGKTFGETTRSIYNIPVKFAKELR